MNWQKNSLTLFSIKNLIMLSGVNNMKIGAINSGYYRGSMVQFKSHIDEEKFDNVNSDNISVTSYSPSKLSIPLAAILATMPLNADTATKLYERDNDFSGNRIEYVENFNNSVDALEQNNGVVIESRKFNSKTLGNVEISLKSTDGNNKTFESVELTYLVNPNSVSKAKYTTKVKGVYKYDYKTISDDGSKGTNFTISELWGADDLTVTNDEQILRYARSLAADPRNNGAIEATTITRMLRPASLGKFMNVPNGNILQKAKPVKIDGKLVLERDMVDNKLGKFKLRFYSTDGNDETAQCVTFKKENCPEVLIDKAYAPLHKFAIDTENPLTFQTGVLALSDKVQNYFIESMDLVKSLYNMGFDEVYNTEIEYLSTSTGKAFGNYKK